MQRGAAVDRGKLKEIEEKDAEIARLIYQQEKLKKAKREKAKQLKKEGQTEEGRGGRREYKHETRREERVSERDGVRHVTRVEEHVTRQDGVTRSHRSQHTRTERSTSGSGRTPPHLLNAREERALPPYRHPPPANAISSPNHSNYSESPPYDRPPLPPHPGTNSYTFCCICHVESPAAVICWFSTGAHERVEYATRPLPETPPSQRHPFANRSQSDASHQFSPQHQQHSPTHYENIRSPPARYPLH